MKLTNLAELTKFAADNHGSSGISDNGGEWLSWPDVHSRSMALAARLVEAGVRPGDRVAVHHPRSAASYIAVHATLLAGAVVVPLDPFGPPEGIAAVMAAVEPAALIAASAMFARHDLESLAASSIVVVCHGEPDRLVDAGLANTHVIDFADATTVASEAVPSDWATPEPDDAAYIIFTSGSTGVPKGIVHTHASGLAFAHMGAAAHAVTPQDRLAAIAPLHFDVSTFDLYAIPLAGASVVMTTEAEQRFPASLSKRLETERVTMVYTTPYQLRQLASRGDIAERDLLQIRQLAFGGEPFAPNALVELGQQFPNAELLNVYGPAEVNGVTVHSFGRAPASLDSVPIGRACEGVEILIVDDLDQVVAAGESGEMLVHSPTTMHGYWRSPERNAASFATLDGRLYYRTGDRAHLDAHGRLQFEGRRDNRIKIRGVRIELEAIERVLEDAPGVAHAVAGRVDDVAGIQQIMAWLVPVGETIDQAAVTMWCRERLPPNAVPTIIELISTVPTTATGKIDRGSLRSSALSNDANRAAKS